MFISLLYWVIILAGTILCASFLILHRPRNWFRARAVNAVGWIIIIFILFLRAVIVSFMRYGLHVRFESTEEMIVSLILGAFVDFLLIVRIKSFLAFKKNPSLYLKSQREVEDAR